jgi:hypothetical protein
MSENGGSAFRQFVLPDKDWSLKVVFDNFRNYAIIGGLAALADWFQSGRASAPPIIIGELRPGGAEVNAWICLAVAAVLFVLNVWQSFYIAKRLLGFDRKSSGAGAGREAFNTLPWYVQLFFSGIFGALFGIIVSIGFLIFYLFVFIVWFAVKG